MNTKKVLMSSGIFVFVALLAFMVWATTLGTTANNVALVNPVSVSNLSGQVQFNVSGLYTLVNATNATNVTLNLTNASSMSSQPTVALFVLLDTDRSRNTSFSNATNASYYNFAANGTINTANLSLINSTTALSDGLYNITLSAVNGTDRIELANYTVLKAPGTDNPANSTHLLVIDNTLPLIRAVNSSNSTSYNITSTVNVTFLFTVTNNSGLEAFSGTDLHRVTVRITNASNGANFNITAVPYTAGAKNTLFNLTINYSRSWQTNDTGNYSFTVYANDTAGNVNATTGFFVVDLLAPNRVELYTPNYSNLTSPRMLFQVNDSLTTQLSCDVYLWNGSVTVMNTTGSLNVSNGTTYNFSTANVPPDGAYNWSVQCNDTAKLQNVSGVGNFTIDVTPPVVTVTCTPSSLSVGESTSCSCSATDATTKVTSTSFTDTSPVTTTAGSFNTGTCTATDLLGNSRDGTGSYTVSGSSTSSGGGSGGSGGGISTSIVSQLEKKTWTSILAGEKATVEVKNGDIGVTSVSFVMDKTAYGVSLEVKSVATLPSTVPPLGSTVYKTLQIVENNVEKGLSGSATVNFKVAKSWLSANNIDKNGVALFHFKDSKWVQLPTTPGSDDATYVYYSAQTPGFSYFVIGKTAQAVAPTAVTAPAAGTPTEVTQPSGVAGEKVTTPAASSSSTAVWVVVGLVLVGLLIWVVMALRRRR